MNISIAKANRRRIVAGIVMLVCSLIVLGFFSIAIGSKHTLLSSTWQAIWHFDPANTDALIIWYSRIPRTLLAVAAACALGCSGLIMQAMTRNPLADPGIFGINSGASLAVVFTVAILNIQSFGTQIVASLVGAFVAGLTIYLLSGVRRGLDPTKLVLAGTAFNVVAMALVEIIIVNGDETLYQYYRNWVVGSFDGRPTSVLIISSVVITVTLLLASLSVRQLDAQILGTDLATALGVNPRTTVIFCCAIVIVLSGTATAAVGPIIFLGLVAPHLARFITGPVHSWALPYTALLAANLALGADILGRIVGGSVEVHVGIMLGLIGGPFFIFLVTRRKLGRI